MVDSIFTLNIFLWPLKVISGLFMEMTFQSWLILMLHEHVLKIHVVDLTQVHADLKQTNLL